MKILNRCIFAVRQQFLGEKLAALALKKATEMPECEFRRATIGQNTHRLNQDWRQTLVAGNVGKHFSFLIEHLKAELPSIAEEVGMKGFTPVEADMVLLAYKDGHFYRRHIDTGVGAEADVTSRKLSCVYYFHQSPKLFSGGEIRIYPLVGDQYTQLDPDHDQLVAFPAFVPHEVLPVSLPGGQLRESRFAITFFFH